MKRKTGILGGTFDPIHFGHLLVAEQCREACGLTEILFIPSARPPHKQRAGMADVQDRVRMVQLAIAGNDRFRLEALETEREGPSYTVDTLRELHRRLPGTDFHFILGADGVNDLPNWHQPSEILELCQLCIVARPGFDAPDVKRLAERLDIDVDQIAHDLVPVIQVDISSRDIRQRIGAGRSCHYMLPEEVRGWIEERKLYRAIVG